MNNTLALLKLKKIDRKFKIFSDKMKKEIFNVLSLIDLQPNNTKLSTEKRENILNLINKLTAIYYLNEYEKFDCRCYYGIRRYCSKNKVETLNHNGKNSMKVLAWKNMSEFTEDRKKLDDKTFVNKYKWIFD